MNKFNFVFSTANEKQSKTVKTKQNQKRKWKGNMFWKKSIKPLILILVFPLYLSFIHSFIPSTLMMVIMILLDHIWGGRFGFFHWINNIDGWNLIIVKIVCVFYRASKKKKLVQQFFSVSYFFDNMKIWYLN